MRQISRVKGKILIGWTRTAENSVWMECDGFAATVILLARVHGTGGEAAWRPPYLFSYNDRAGKSIFGLLARKILKIRTGALAVDLFTLHKGWCNLQRLSNKIMIEIRRDNAWPNWYGRPLPMSHLRLSRRLCPFQLYSRPFAAISSNSPPPTLNTVGPYQVFDRSAKVIQRDNAARREGGVKSRTVDYVRDEVAERMLERFMVGLVYGFLNVHSCTMLNWGYQKEIRNCHWLRFWPRTFLEIVGKRQSPKIHHARFQR